MNYKNQDSKCIIKKRFVGIGDEKPRADKTTEVRHSVVVVIKDNKTDTYLCEDAKGRNCRSFIMGGVEANETPAQAAIRETLEETGYKDIVIDHVSDYVIVNHFFAAYKGVNRYAYIHFVYGHLNSKRRREISASEKKKHDFLWVAEEKLSDFITIPMNRYAISEMGGQKDEP